MQIPAKATARSRVGVLKSVLLVYCFRERGNISKGCSDDLQLFTCLETCPMAQGELHTQSISQHRKYGAVWEQTGMEVTWCIPIFPIWLPSLDTCSRTGEWLLEVVRIGESAKGNPLWELLRSEHSSLLQALSGWTGFCWCPKGADGMKRYIFNDIYIYMHEWVETQRKHWKNELDFSSLERHFSWFFYLGGNLWLACWSTYFCGHRMMRYGWQDWWPSFRPRPSRYRLRIRRLDGKKLGHAAWMRLQPGVQNGCIVVVGGWIHFCTGMRPWNAADPFTNSFVGHGLSLSWFPPQW